MAAIKLLLNPLADTVDQYSTSMDSKDEASTAESDAGLVSDILEGVRGKPSRKKQKVSKDAAVFKAGPIRGDCRYPPHEEHDEFLAEKHEMFNVYPVGSIASYARHIPYNSEKKLFLEKTGRDYFEVFQYEFKLPGEGPTYTMIWDYNIGIVRTTPLFKCGQYSKTTPAKMLARNEGLKEICHSITGGALVAQGYWIPYEAAKAVAATFCWNIRYALTPVFGKDFPELCIPPDSEDFGNMQIDPAITKKCAEQARLYRELESTQKEVFNSPSLMSTVSNSGTRTPTTPKFKREFKKIMPKPLNIPSGFVSDDASSVTSREDDKYVLSSPSPQTGFSNPWSAVNSPRSPSPKIKFKNPWSPATSTRSDSPCGGSRRKKHRDAVNIPRSYAPLDTMPPPYKPLYHVTLGAAEQQHADGDEAESAAHDSDSSPAAYRRMDLDEDYDAGSDDSDAPSGSAVAVASVTAMTTTARKKSTKAFTDFNAALVLMQMRDVSKGLTTGLRRLKRPASM
ncbi:uncharacterized protein A1O9_11517 [Exophiala aquamarina CBS 119918]|uniref:HTH APSES-type domain-containing protein n=1 Tax=Exophiala aquamarina CBS 119918 TaxID=1182545 RepID=A0A072NY12_9EURO|nr:uncharacterized protein A1O9_11517 [Exophiala aquamarina CBS 119918]KEF52277.1 hypothetical protein A1O9_11517 [Exophiala aquamarina CBS 119918]